MILQIYVSNICEQRMFSNLHWICLGIGCWVALNGILHTIAVVRQHKDEYTRDYLRLLMDGLILVTCGVIQILSFRLIEDKNIYGYLIAGSSAFSLLIYCALIFPFLKSIFTILINSFLLILIIVYLLMH